MKIRVWISTALIVSSCFALPALADVHPPREDFGLVEVQQEPELIHVRFLSGDDVLYELDILSGDAPEEFLPEAPEGFRFSKWSKKVREITEDTDYQAVYVPALTEHVPYLFARKDGFLHPEEVMTKSDFRSAISALATDAALEALPQLPKGSKKLEIKELKAVLKALFPEEYAVMSYQFKGMESITRLEFVQLMNPLLGRSGEQITPTDETVGFPDVPKQHPHMRDLMEAAAAHTVGEDMWSSYLFPTAAEPGRVEMNGRWGIIDDNGYLVANKKLEGSLRAGKDGYYSSGNAELDTVVADILQKIQRKHPKATKEEMLRYCYEYVRDSFKYLRKAAYSTGDTGWEAKDALVMFTTGKGNCYNYAAAFWSLARGLGFDAKAYSGLIGSASGGLTPHGWVSINFDGVKYYFDTEMEMSFLTRGNSSYNGYFYKLELTTAAGWAYQEPHKGA